MKRFAAIQGCMILTNADAAISYINPLKLKSLYKKRYVSSPESCAKKIRWKFDEYCSGIFAENFIRKLVISSRKLRRHLCLQIKFISPVLIEEGGNIFRRIYNPCLIKIRKVRRAICYELLHFADNKMSY